MQQFEVIAGFALVRKPGPTRLIGALAGQVADQILKEK
jgi:hypothetical protein